ncbi:hypothetical protein IQ254_21270 [Nodosilinea sp. LEGE 07088]|uniref:hypothetical protein n=1 Tax=Nodosilinea sp. LEGE 07088 TaxID=2777968 RepID=UPI00187F5705|nr:hypothetical protein [Nodosilinea sp. LEGE 07088]MBE9139695.1 hypothetical protein [Nodosilinea sp. LEGE 07088]
MTDTTASSTSPEDGNNTPRHQPETPGPQPSADDASGWEAVTLPGQLPLATISTSADEVSAEEHGGNDALRWADGQVDAVAVEPDLSSPEPAPEDLVQLIQDLNQCNDALLLRVTELEDELERSQLALQAEVERNQASMMGLPTATPPGPVQQQIAQLLSELDIANDGLRRTTIHNETIHAELETNQQRVAQLERECTLLQQRFSDKTMALQQAEETCRDLKARLHRQQRYTLQFKAALEKCLNTAPGSAGMGAAKAAAAPVARAAGQPVTMPRSQQIQPWSGGQGALGDNPSLTQLLRGLRGPGSATPAEPQHPPALATSPTLGVAADLSAALAEPEPVVSPPVTPVAPALEAPDPWLETSPAPAPAPAVDQATLFTEPSPWGEPVMPVGPAVAPQEAMPIQPTVAASAVAPVPPTEPMSPAAPAPMAATPAAPALPSYLLDNSKPSPSPLVYPLRSQKKITSIAAVELPSFGRARRR